MTLKEARQTLGIEEGNSLAEIEGSWRGLLFFRDPEKCDGNEKLRKKGGEKIKKSTRRMILAFEVLSTFASFLFFAALCLVSGIFFFVKPFIKRLGKHDFIFSEMYRADRALELLKKGSNRPNAKFREGQEEAIRHVVNGLGRLLVVQKTGWGKSFVYFIATKLLREAGKGPALLVSPLLALMRNQIAAAERMGVRAETINSDNEKRWSEVEDAVCRDKVDILLIRRNG